MTKAITVAVFLAMVLCLGLGECASAERATESRVFSVLYNQGDDKPFQEDWLILDEYENRQNVRLDIQLGDNADYLATVIRTLEAGNAPDIILKVWPSEIEGYASSGALLAFSDYEDLMPYFMAYVTEHGLEQQLDSLRLANGKYYILPGYQRAIQVQQWIYRKDLFEQHHLGVPDTYDDLLAALAILKGIYPHATPLTACWGGAHLLAMMGAGYGIPAGWNGARFYDSEQTRWRFAPTTDNYKQLYVFLNQCYRAGVLDPDVFTQSDVDYYAKLLDGRGFVTVSWIGSGFQTWNQALQDNGFPSGEWAPLPVPESTVGIRAVPPVDPFRKGLIVPSRVEHESYFEDLLRFLDWAVYSEEGMTLTTWGVEGITFENTSEGKALLPQILTPRNPDGTIDMTSEYGFATLFDLNENEEFEDYKKPADIVTFLDRSLEAGETEQAPPALTLGTSSLAAIDQINPSIIIYASETGRNFISGAFDIEQYWGSYIRELERKGYQTLEAIWNLAWDQQAK